MQVIYKGGALKIKHFLQSPLGNPNLLHKPNVAINYYQRTGVKKRVARFEEKKLLKKRF